MKSIYRQILIITVFSFIMLTNIFGQSVIKGTIRDADGPLVGAIAVIKGSTNYSEVDSTGQFYIKIKNFPVVLEASFLGYQTKEITYTKDPGAEVEIFLVSDNILNEIVVTSRRRQEVAQDLPIPVTVLGAQLINESGAFNVNRVKEIAPSVQLYSSNARNTGLNIRGLGSSFGLTNDGLDPGVGFYVDGVYYARPAATTLDFIDIEQIEILRGPQGTLFGKNTTSGAFNITSKKPTLDPGLNVEVSYGNYGFIQAKSSLSGPIAKKFYGRFSFAGTQRNGLFHNVKTNLPINDLNNLGFRGQLLYLPTSKLSIRLIGDISDQKPGGYGWPVAGVVPTKRPAFRQFNNIISDLGYTIPYKSAFERIVDLDTPSKADNQLGGASVNIDYEIGNGTLTSTTAWRYWKWVPLNDRDYLGIPSFTISAGNSVHDQWSQEFRYAGNLGKKITGVAGLYGLWQDLKTDPVHTEEAGAVQWRFIQNNTNPLWKTPGLLDNFGIRTTSSLLSSSLAAFAQADWEISEKLHFLPGIRYNYDNKIVNYDRKTYGGLQTTDPALLALKNTVYNNQTFAAEATDRNWSGQVTLQYYPVKNINTFATYSISYKPVGVNIGGLPRINNETAVSLAQVKPESVSHYEFGLKTKPSSRSVLNLVFHNSDIKDYQTLVQTPEPGVNRGYLANAEKVRVYGLEFDGSVKLTRNFTINSALAYTIGKYVSFINAPVPLEEVGGAQAFKDISGGDLPGISKWAGSVGVETLKDGKFLSLPGEFFLNVESFFRSDFSSSPSPSQFLNIQGYILVNGRIGFRAKNNLTLLLWARNLLNKDYYEQLIAAPGSAGHFAGVVADPRTYGFTLQFAIK